MTFHGGLLRAGDGRELVRTSGQTVSSESSLFTSALSGSSTEALHVLGLGTEAQRDPGLLTASLKTGF